MSASSPMNVALIGCGGMGSWHADNVATQPGVRLLAVSDVFVPAAQVVADRTGAVVMAPDQAIAACDAVVIASSDETHAEFAVAAIGQGKRVFVEKPLGATVEQAQAVLDAEVAGGVVLTRVGFMRELDPAHMQVKQALDTLGPITRVRSVHRNVDGARREASVLFSQSIIHDIHTIRWLSGQEFVSVTSHVAQRPDGFRDVLLVGELSGGAIGTVDFEDQAFAYEVQVEVTAVGGMAVSLPHPRAIVKSAARESIVVGTDWFGRFEDAYRAEMIEWCRDIQRPPDPAAGPTVWDGYAAQLVADAGVEAMQSGARVAISIPDRPAMYRSTLYRTTPLDEVES